MEFFIVMFAILWVILSGIIASNKKRSVALWVILAILFGIFALIPLMCLKDLSKNEVKNANDQ
jgi:RsiW-degrading membrane proteinase PrsW (M82 family)